MNSNNFIISDKIVANFCNSSLINIRKRLANSYSKTQHFFENIDYIKIQTGKTSAITYMLNYQCFEKIAINNLNSEYVKIYIIKLREYLTYLKLEVN